jgi:hypothetical protein
MTRQRNDSAIIRGLTHADTYIGEGSEREAGITLGRLFRRDTRHYGSCAISASGLLYRAPAV